MKKVITFRANDNLIEYIKQIEQTTGKKKSDVIRDLIINGKINTDTGKVKISYELNRIGNNINQIARNCNIKKAVDIAVLEQLKIIENLLSEIAKNDM